MNNSFSRPFSGQVVGTATQASLHRLQLIQIYYGCDLCLWWLPSVSSF